MPIGDFEGDTFVAFLDISGFKVLMRDEQRALKALDRFYKTGFSVLRGQNDQRNIRVEGLFISDSGILFVRNGDTQQQLEAILDAIQKINKEMLKDDFMLTTSVAYGLFKYHERIEFTGIEKNAIYGGAYVKAFLDNEKGTPRIQPGQCRVVKKELPNRFADLPLNTNSPVLRKLKVDKNHFYFYWMVNHPEEIQRFEQRYNDAYNLKYKGMLMALKGEPNQQL